MEQNAQHTDPPPTKHELDKIREYEGKGYTSTFMMKDGRFTDISSGQGYTMDEVRIIEEYRYEGMSNPDDLSILYVLETSDGNKGLVLRPYGANATEEIDQFLKKVSMSQKKNS